MPGRKTPPSAFSTLLPCNAAPINPKAGPTCLQASPWSSGYLNGGLKSEEMKSEELAEEGCFQHKGFNGMPSAAGEAGLCSGLLSLSVPAWTCQVMTSTQPIALSDKWASSLSPDQNYCWLLYFGWLQTHGTLCDPALPACQGVLFKQLFAQRLGSIAHH